MDGRVYKCPKRAMTVPALLAAAVWAVPFTAVMLFVPVGTPLWHICFWTITAIAAAYILVYLPCYRLTVKLVITDGLITYKSGLFVSRRRYMKRDRVIYVTYFRTPLTPLLGISSIRISAAGSAVSVPFLLNDDAQEIEEILGKNGSGAGV